MNIITKPNAIRKRGDGRTHFWANAQDSPEAQLACRKRLLLHEDGYRPPYENQLKQSKTYG